MGFISKFDNKGVTKLDIYSNIAATNNIYSNSLKRR